MGDRFLSGAGGFERGGGGDLLGSFPETECKILDRCERIRLSRDILQRLFFLLMGCPCQEVRKMLNLRSKRRWMRP